MTLRTKYGGKLGGVMYPAGTEVEVLRPDDSEVQEQWPGIRRNDASESIAVRFPGRVKPTVALRREFVD